MAWQTPFLQSYNMKILRYQLTAASTMAPTLIVDREAVMIAALMAFE
jgi:hypothetical protein